MNVAIFGHNGSGKSSLTQFLNNELPFYTFKEFPDVVYPRYKLLHFDYAFILYDITSQKGRNSIIKWIDICKKNNLSFVVLANKCESTSIHYTYNSPSHKLMYISIHENINLNSVVRLIKSED